LLSMRRLFGSNLCVGLGLLLIASRVWAADWQARPAKAGTPNGEFLERYCVECHDTQTKKGGLDLTELPFEPNNLTNFNKWVLINDRVTKSEMPPKKKERPERGESDSFIKSLSAAL